MTVHLAWWWLISTPKHVPVLIVIIIIIIIIILTCILLYHTSRCCALKNWKIHQHYNENLKYCSITNHLQSCTAMCKQLLSVFRAISQFEMPPEHNASQNQSEWSYSSKPKYRIFSNLIHTSFCRFLKRKKKLVRGSNPHLPFNCPLPTRQTDSVMSDDGESDE